MGDILSKLKMVSEKLGVTETAHTIEEQIDLISESLDKVPASTNIAEALDDLSEVAENVYIPYNIKVRFSDGSVEYYTEIDPAIQAIKADNTPKVEAIIGRIWLGLDPGDFADCINLAKVRIPNQLNNIANNAFENCPNLTEFIIDRPENSISGAPWGATNATITWTGRPVPDSEDGPGDGDII